MEEDKKCNEQERKNDYGNGEGNSINKREKSDSTNSQESELEMNKVVGSDGEGRKEQIKPTDKDCVVTTECGETEENKDNVLMENDAAGTDNVESKEELLVINERKKETHDSRKDCKEKTLTVDEEKGSEVINEVSKKIEGDTHEKSEKGSIARKSEKQEFEKCQTSEEDDTKKNILEHTSEGDNNIKDKETEAIETSVHEHDSKEDNETITTSGEELRTNISKVSGSDIRNSVIEDKQKCESSSIEIFAGDKNVELDTLQNQKSSVETQELNTSNEILPKLPKKGHGIELLNKEPTSDEPSVSPAVKETADDKKSDVLSNTPQVSEGTIMRIKQASQDKDDSNVSVNKINDEKLDEVKEIELSHDMNSQKNDNERHTEVLDVETRKGSTIVTNTKSDVGVEEGKRKDTEVRSELETQSKERQPEKAKIQGEPSVVEGCDVTSTADTDDRKNISQTVLPSNKTIIPTIGNDEVSDKRHAKSAFTEESTKNESDNKVIKLKDAKQLKEKNIVTEEECENKDQKEELNCSSTEQDFNHESVKVLKSSATEYEFQNKKDTGMKECAKESSKSQEIRKESKAEVASKHTESLPQKKVDDKNKTRATHNTTLNHCNDKPRDTVFQGAVTKRVKCEEKAQRSSITNSKSNQECNKSRNGPSISTEDVMKDQMKQLESKIHSSQEKPAQKSHRTFKQPAKQKQQEHKEIQNKQQSDKLEEKQTQQVHIREQNQIQKALQQNKSTQEKKDQQIQEIKKEQKLQIEQKQQIQKQPVQKFNLQEGKPSMRTCRQQSQKQDKSEASSRNELDHHLKQKQPNQKEQVQNQEQQKTQEQQFEEKFPARKNQQQIIHKHKEEDKNNYPGKQEKRTKIEQQQQVKQETKIDPQQEHQTIRKVQHELKNHKENVQQKSELNQQEQSKLDKREIKLKQKQDYEQEDPKEQQKDKQSSQQQQQKQQEESKQMQQSEDGEDDNAPGCGGIQGSSCPIYFGVKSYLHHFYDSTPMKNSQLYEEYIEEDDFEYSVDPVKNRGCRKCCRGFWFRAGLWGGINLILVGVITLLVGYLTPQREIVVGHQNNLEILDRSAIAFNRRLELCRLAGLAVFCCGGLVLLLTLLLSTFFHIGGHNNNNGHCCGENAYYGYVTTSLVEPFIPGQLHCSTVPAATGIKIPITEQIKSVQPSLWPDIATVKDGALVPHMP